jgi:hypothetical protein
MLTAQRLRKVLSYDRTTGIFRWKILRAGNAVAGAIAGCLTHRGYLYIRIDRRSYSGGRLAWLYVTGKWPVPEIGYINGDPSDMRWANLREATRSQNRARTRSKNKLGARGIWLSKSDRYVAQIKFMGKLRYLGSFNTIREAKAAYERAAKKHFGEFAAPL